MRAYMKYFKHMLICVISVIGFTNINAQLVKIWETNEIFKAPESVAYDSERGFLYISNFTENVEEG